LIEFERQSFRAVSVLEGADNGVITMFWPPVSRNALEEKVKLFLAEISCLPWVMESRFSQSSIDLSESIVQRMSVHTSFSFLPLSTCSSFSMLAVKIY
jgi:hypothetical protein